MPDQSIIKSYPAERYSRSLYPRWFVGLPADFWLINVGMIKDVIKQNELRPIAAESLHQEYIYGPMNAELNTNVDSTRARARKLKLPFPFPGGIRVPHLHFKGDLFVLNEEQWSGFSKKVVDRLQNKLAGANSVNFEQVVRLSNAIDHM